MPALVFLAVFIASTVVFLVMMAWGRVALGCVIGVFVFGLAFIALASKILLGSYWIFLKTLSFALLLASVMAVLFIVFGKGAGSFVGRGLFGSIFYPADSRKTEKEHSIIKSHIQLGKYDEAVEEYKKELEESPGDVQVLWELATIYAYNLKDYDNAAACLEKIIAAEKKVNRQMWCMSVFRATEIYTKNLDNKHRARELLNRLIKRCPKSKESMMAEIRLFGKRVNGTTLDSYYEIRIDKDTYSEVNQRLLEKWIGRGLAPKQTLVMNTETGRWNNLRDLKEFEAFWP